MSGFMIHHRKGYGIISIALVILPVMTAVFPSLKSLGGAACVMIGIGVVYGLAAEGKGTDSYLIPLYQQQECFRFFGAKSKDQQCYIHFV